MEATTSQPAATWIILREWSGGHKDTPAWQRRAAIVGGMVFLPAQLWFPMKRIKKTLDAGTPRVWRDRHIYVPWPWLAMRLPDGSARDQVFDAEKRFKQLHTYHLDKERN